MYFFESSKSDVKSHCTNIIRSTILPPMSFESYTGIPYEKSAGPRALEELGTPIGSANCQRLVQEFMFREFDLPLEPERVLSKESFEATGTTVIDNSDGIIFSAPEVTHGNVVYAKPKNSENIPKEVPPTEYHMAIIVHADLEIQDEKEIQEEKDNLQKHPTVQIRHTTNRTNGQSKSCIISIGELMRQ